MPERTRWRGISSDPKRIIEVLEMSGRDLGSIEQRFEGTTFRFVLLTSPMVERFDIVGHETARKLMLEAAIELIEKEGLPGLKDMLTTATEGAAREYLGTGGTHV